MCTLRINYYWITFFLKKEQACRRLTTYRSLTHHSIAQPTERCIIISKERRSRCASAGELQSHTTQHLVKTRRNKEDRATRASFHAHTRDDKILIKLVFLRETIRDYRSLVYIDIRYSIGMLRNPIVALR